MRLWIAVAIALAASSCTYQRYLELPDPAPTFQAERVGDETWRVGEIFTRVSLTAANGNLAGTNINTDRLRDQLTERLRGALLSQRQLGAVTGPATYSLEVTIDARESYGPGKGAVAGLLGSLAFAFGSMGAGAAIGAATKNASGGDNYLVGLSIGGAVGLIGELLISTIAETGGVRGEYEAQLTLRRLSDRVPVATRRVATPWQLDMNSYDFEKKLARASGASVAAFEKAVVQAVSELLVEQQLPAAARPLTP